jgi:hypothetical protein
MSSKFFGFSASNIETVKKNPWLMDKITLYAITQGWPSSTHSRAT